MAVDARVLIVDDSAVARGIWSKKLSKVPGISVVGTATNGKNAVEFTKNNHLDVVLLDIQMPVMNGLEAIPLLLKEKRNLKIFILSAVGEAGSKEAVEALQLGASEVFLKPSTIKGTTVDDVVHDVSRKIVNVTRYPTRQGEPNSQGSHFKLSTRSIFVPEAIVIASSTGGPKALTQFFGELDPKVNVPIFIVQHIPKEFAENFRLSIEKCSKRTTRLANDFMPVKEGNIYIAPGDMHMELVNKDNMVFCRVNDKPPENFCRPAADPLFRTAAQVYKNKLMAMVFTGMGEDGRRGCEEVHRNHGYVIAQDEESSVVWGMPGAVAEAGLANSVLSLKDMPFKLNDLFIRGVKDAG